MKTTDYKACTLCEHRCGVDRRDGAAGRCAAPALPRIFCELVEYAEEADLSPSCSVSLSGCNFRCGFCITGRDSQDASRGTEADLDALAARIRAGAVEARSVLIVGGEPTVYLPWLEELVARVGPIPCPWVLKTNLYTTPEALDRALAVFDVILADLKFGSDSCAERLAGIRGYGDVLRRNLTVSAARRRTIVRHLVMPGHLECCTRPVVDWIRRDARLEVSVRDHFVPAWNSSRFPEIARTTSPEESAAVEAMMEEVGPWNR